MNNIRDILWEEGITTPEEYLVRREFYGYMSKPSEKQGGIDDISYGNMSSYLTESSDNQDNSIGAGMLIDIGKFGWEEGYDREMRNYLKNGIGALKIYTE